MKCVFFFIVIFPLSVKFRQNISRLFFWNSHDVFLCHWNIEYFTRRTEYWARLYCPYILPYVFAVCICIYILELLLFMKVLAVTQVYSGIILLYKLRATLVHVNTTIPIFDNGRTYKMHAKYNNTSTRVHSSRFLVNIYKNVHAYI